MHIAMSNKSHVDECSAALLPHTLYLIDLWSVQEAATIPCQSIFYLCVDEPFSTSPCFASCLHELCHAHSTYADEKSTQSSLSQSPWLQKEERQEEVRSPRPA